MSQWKLIFEFIPLVPAYFPSCCDSAAAPSDFSALSSESLGNPCARLAEFVASGVLQETPSSIHAPAVSAFQPLTACTIFGFGVSAELQQRLSLSASSHLEVDFSTPVLSSWKKGRTRGNMQFLVISTLQKSLLPCPSLCFIKNEFQVHAERFAKCSATCREFLMRRGVSSLLPASSLLPQQAPGGCTGWPGTCVPLPVWVLPSLPAQINLAGRAGSSPQSSPILAPAVMAMARPWPCLGILWSSTKTQ